MITDQMFKEAVLDLSSKLTQIILLLKDIKELNKPPEVHLMEALMKEKEYKIRNNERL